MEKQQKVEIGARIKEFAKKNFSSVAELARQFGMPKSYFQPYIKGISVLGGETLAILAELGCDINWLLTGKKFKDKKGNGIIILQLQ